MYSRQKEDDVEQEFIGIGFNLVEDTGRRKKHKADKIMRSENCNLTLAIDHKSTKNKEGIRITKEMLDKIKLEAGEDIPVITFNLYEMQRKFMIIEIKDFGLFCR